MQERQAVRQSSIRSARARLSSGRAWGRIGLRIRRFPGDRVDEADRRVIGALVSQLDALHEALVDMDPRLILPPFPLLERETAFWPGIGSSTTGPKPSGAASFNTMKSYSTRRQAA